MNQIENHKLIEDFVTSIYVKDIDNYGEKSFYPQILKSVSSVNLRKFKGHELTCNDITFSSCSLGASINSISRGLNLPRETIRRKILELIKLEWLYRHNSQIYVSQKWRVKNLENNLVLIRTLKKLLKNF